MARQKKGQKKMHREEVIEKRFGLNPEAKRGIAVVFLFAVAALLFLSLFDIAGQLGQWIDRGLTIAFGWDKFLLPIALVLVGFGLIGGERVRFSTWNYLGLFFFFLSFNALLNLLVSAQDAQTPGTLAGGYIGEFLGGLLPQATGFWGALVIVCALLLVSILLLFNTSLSNVLGAHRHLGGIMRLGFGRKDDVQSWESSVREEEEDMDETDQEEEEEEEEMKETENDVEEEKEAPRKKVPASKPEGAQEPLGETVLTTRQQRKVTIPMDLLDYYRGKANSGDIERNKEIIEKTFEQFGIDVEMGETATGATVTQYTLRPAQGVKLARIIALQNDLALALAAHPIRIEAPIPGKSLVGIEVPNQRIAKVALRELLESKPFAERTSQISFPLGTDVTGRTWISPIDRMPHLLIAGATGSGKSVCLNTLIVSLLYQNGPDDLKLILVDPKRVELTAYAGIPHLLVPPIIKSDDTVNALRWTVREMERRLDLLSKFGARDITSYNARAEEKMPRIIVAIDELADLMSTNGREVEANVVRIAQMARAVGIHLVLATQRPSVDVITGLIKANFPARIAFAVASQTDSRTILDCSGAEKLLGRGDMLYTDATLSKPKRLQGAFISEEESGRIVEFLKQQGMPNYNYAITETQKTGTVLDGADDDEPLLDEAVNYLLQAGKASTSLLQRRLKIGYSRAARMMDLLEERGVIGPADGAKPREILVDEWPIGGDVTEGMPTAQDDLDEADEGAHEAQEAQGGEEDDHSSDLSHPTQSEDEVEDEEDEKTDTPDLPKPTLPKDEDDWTRS